MLCRAVLVVLLQCYSSTNYYIVLRTSSPASFPPTSAQFKQRSATSAAWDCVSGKHPVIYNETDDVTGRVVHFQAKSIDVTVTGGNVTCLGLTVTVVASHVTPRWDSDTEPCPEYEMSTSNLEMSSNTGGWTSKILTLIQWDNP